MASRMGRNELCHCGSGKKYKHCHWEADRATAQPTRTMPFTMSGELPTGGVPGADFIIVVNANNVVRRGPFRIVFTLCRPDAAVSREIVTNYEKIDGDSNIMLNNTGESGEVGIDLAEPNSDLVAALTANEAGRFSRLEIGNVRAQTLQEARLKGARIAHDIFSSISLMHDSPIEVFQIDAIDAGGNREITARMPYSYGVLEPSILCGGDPQKLAALYREGLMTRQNFYAFLCFYRILEAVDKLDATDAAKAKEQGQSPKRRARTQTPETDADVVDWIRDLLPPWYEWNNMSIGNVAPPLARGKRYSQIREKHLKPLRDSIAHGLLDDVGIVDIDDPYIQDQVQYWLVYTRMMAKRLLFARYLPDSFPSA